MIHVELHLADDPAELGDEAAEHARLVHQAERALDVARFRQHAKECADRLGVAAQLRGDQVERSAGGGEGVGVKVEIALVGDLEQPDQICRIAFEHLRPGDGETPVLHREAERQTLAPHRRGARQKAGQPLRLLLLTRLELRAESAGQASDLARDQKVAAHEPLHGRGAASVNIAHAAGDLWLEIEGQPLLRPPGGEVQVRPYRPQKIQRAQERLAFGRGGKVEPGELLDIVHRMQVTGDPEQGVEVAQAALAVLHIRLDQIARSPRAGVATVALGQLGGDELRPGPLDQLLAEPLLQLSRKRGVAREVASFQQGGAGRGVLARQAEAFLCRARGVADL